ncbi:MAG: amidohydrolase [Armatimonadetes bacterium]|nr:amidohydrolase [Armatimonadota bacterium]
MFISHCHTGATEFGLSKEPGAGTIELLVEILAEAGADGAVAFAPFPSEGLGWGGEAARQYADPNDWLLDQLQSYPQLRGFANVNPGKPGAAERLRELVAAGMVGAKVHPPVHRISLDDPALNDFWAAADELRLPIHIHTGVHGALLRTYRPILLDDIANAYPNLSIIIDHLGGYAFFNEALAVIQNNRNVYAGMTQVSGRAAPYTITQERLQVLIDTVGPSRMIYGLDYPWNPDNRKALLDDIAWVRSWGLSEEDTNAVLGGNILRLIDRVIPPGRTS